MSASKKSVYQVNSLIVQVVFQRLLELPDHGLHKLAPEVVVPGIQEANQGRIHAQLLRKETGAANNNNKKTTTTQWKTTKEAHII